jgi:hypothetical protein
VAITTASSTTRLATQVTSSHPQDLATASNPASHCFAAIADRMCSAPVERPLLLPRTLQQRRKDCCLRDVIETTFSRWSHCSRWSRRRTEASGPCIARRPTPSGPGGRWPPLTWCAASHRLRARGGERLRVQGIITTDNVNVDVSAVAHYGVADPVAHERFARTPPRWVRARGQRRIARLAEDVHGPGSH